MQIGVNVSTLGYTQCGFASPVHYQKTPVQYGPNNPLPIALQRNYRRGYYAAVSWMDSQIGRLLDALDTLGVADDTVVALWYDFMLPVARSGSVLLLSASVIQQ